MTYTNPWSDAIPVGTDPANTLDTIIQQVRLDVHQRMTTLIGSASGCDWTDDPIIDGVNALDLVSLTALANSKTTLSGLTIGQMVKAISAGQVGNSAVAEASLTGIATAPITGTATALPLTTVLNLGNGIGTFIVSCEISSLASNADVQFSIVNGTGTLSGTAHHVLSGTNNIITLLVIVNSASPTASLHIALSTGGASTSMPYVIKQLL